MHLRCKRNTTQPILHEASQQSPAWETPVAHLEVAATLPSFCKRGKEEASRSLVSETSLGTRRRGLGRSRASGTRSPARGDYHGATAERAPEQLQKLATKGSPCVRWMAAPGRARVCVPARFSPLILRFHSAQEECPHPSCPPQTAFFFLPGQRRRPLIDVRVWQRPVALSGICRL